MIILKCATVTGRKKKSNKNRNTIMIILKWWQCYFSCSGTFSNLRKANISFVMLACPSVSPSVRMEQLGSHWKDFHEILYLSILQKSVKEIQVPLKSDKHNGYFTWRSVHITLSYLPQFFLEWELFQTKFVGKIKIHILCTIFFFSRTVQFVRYCGNTVEPDRPQMII